MEILNNRLMLIADAKNHYQTTFNQVNGETLSSQT